MPKYTRLTQLERDRISTMLAANHTYSTIAEVLGRSVSTIGREVYRNHIGGAYLPSAAQKMAVRRQRSAHARPSKILSDPQMSSLIRAHLSARWSPQQIARRLLTEHNMQVSHETIYQYIYVQTKGELKKELISYLRHRKSKR